MFLVCFEEMCNLIGLINDSDAFSSVGKLSFLTVRDAHTLYHSDHARDAVFNALPATYSTKWEGLSVIYPHPGDPALTDKAVRWAAYSSRLTNRPTATLVVLAGHPAGTTTSDPEAGRGNPPTLAHQRWTRDHPDICKIIWTSPGHVAPSTDVLWEQQVKHTTPPRRRLEILAIWNPAGREAWGRTVAASAASRATRAPSHSDSLEIPGKCPRKLLAAPNQTPASAPQAAHGTYPYPEPTPLLHDWTHLAYTDGSLGQHRAPDGRLHKTEGAAVYWPAHNGQGGGSKVVTVRPGGEGDTCTINRAELCAIYAGLMDEDTTVIATDSASSIYQLRKMLLTPTRLAHHLHRDLLSAIAQLIRDRATPVTFLKVTSHNGTIGNNMADAAAKQAADPEHLPTQPGN